MLDPNTALLLLVLALVVYALLWTWSPEISRALASLRLRRSERRLVKIRERLLEDFEQLEARRWQLERLRAIGKIGMVGLGELASVRRRLDEVRFRLYLCGAGALLPSRGERAASGTGRSAA